MKIWRHPGLQGFRFRKRCFFIMCDPWPLEKRRPLELNFRRLVCDGVHFWTPSVLHYQATLPTITVYHKTHHHYHRHLLGASYQRCYGRRVQCVSASLDTLWRRVYLLTGWAHVIFVVELYATYIKKVSPRGRRDDMPPPMAVRRWHIVSPPIRPPWIQKSRRIYVRPRTGPQSAHLWWWPAVAKLQASSVPIAQAGSCAMGQTDGQADRRTDRAIPKWSVGRGIISLCSTSSVGSQRDAARICRCTAPAARPQLSCWRLG